MNPAYSYSGLRLSTTSLKDGTPSRTELFIEPINQFAAEMDAFSRCVLQNKPVPTPGKMGLQDMRIVLAAKRLWNGWALDTSAPTTRPID
jgi:predicted dehydrogenase